MTPASPYGALAGGRRGDVMKLPDVAVKAELETAMDERRTGEDGYRRPVLQARTENPQRPGRPIEPFGLTKAETKALVNGRDVGYVPYHHREALGVSVRRYTESRGRTTKAPSEALPLVERLRRSAMRLSDDDLAGLIDSARRR